MDCEPVSSETIKINDNKCRHFAAISKPYEITLIEGAYFVSLKGASGGITTLGKNISPGLGGQVQGVINIKKQRTFFLYVGSKGTNSNANTPGVGGYNGGVSGGIDRGSDNNCASAGSGGATDIRLLKGSPDDKAGLISRIIVAGGGGSGGCWVYAGAGGNGGGLSGGYGKPTMDEKCIYQGGLPGNQTHGFKFGIGEVGKDGPAQTLGEAAGSGGGGYWGGYSGNNGDQSCSGSGGGGGSSFISGHPGCLAVDINGNTMHHSVHYSGIRFYGTYIQEGVNEGDGSAVIVRVSNKYIRSCVYRRQKNIFVSTLSILLSSI